MTLHSERLKKTPRRFAVGVNPPVSENKRSHQPSPNGSLVVSAVTLARTASVTSLVSGFTLRKTAKAVRSEQAARASIHDRFLLLWGKRTLRQRHCEDLIRPQRGVVAGVRVINHVVATRTCVVPEFCKAFLDRLGHFLDRLRGLSSDVRKLGYGLQCVVPKRVHFHGFADARCDNAIPNLRVHPGKLNSVLARMKETIGLVRMNVVPSSSQMGVDDLRQNRIQV